MEGKREGKGRGSSLRASSLAAGIGGRNRWGGAVRDLARRLDPERVLLLSFWKKTSLTYRRTRRIPSRFNLLDPGRVLLLKLWVNFGLFWFLDLWDLRDLWAEGS